MEKISQFAEIISISGTNQITDGLIGRAIRWLGQLIYLKVGTGAINCRSKRNLGGVEQI